jgi:uncharacterized protein (TIRG00374 family)
MSASRSHHGALALKIVVTVLLLAWMAFSTDLDAIGATVRRLDAGVIGSALLCVLAQQAVLAWRWHRIVHWLGGTHWSLAQSLRWVFVALFFNQALPTAVGGDAVRIWALYRHGMARHVAIGSVAVERGSGLGLLALTIAMAVWLAPSVGGPRTESALLGASLLIVVVLIAALFTDKWLTRWLPSRAADIGARFANVMRSLLGALGPAPSLPPAAAWPRGLVCGPLSSSAAARDSSSTRACSSPSSAEPSC